MFFNGIFLNLYTKEMQNITTGGPQPLCWRESRVRLFSVDKLFSHIKR